jgi:hypothetical protein
LIFSRSASTWLDVISSSLRLPNLGQHITIQDALAHRRRAVCQAAVAQPDVGEGLEVT